MEGRPNGRLVCYDPKTKKTWTVLNHFYFPNGICVSHDGKSVLIASTSLCKVFRYRLEGPRKGALEILIDDLPGLADNINRASDGT
jgi:ribose transport system permease protein